MNGAIALDCENTISKPKSTNTTTIGTSQYFFSWRRNCKNSVSTRPLPMSTSVHARVVLLVSVSGGIGAPPAPRGAPAREWILAGEPPDQAERNQHDGEQHREQHARVD